MVNIGLRALTLGSRFVLLFMLAAWLPPSELGVYGLVAAVVGYGIYLVGWEFYTYSGRALIAADAAQRAHMLGQLGLFYVAAYLLGFMVLALAAAANVLPEGYFLWIAALLLFEFLAQEVHRNLVALSHQLVASLVLFVRMGAWCIVVMAVMHLEPDLRSVPVVLAAWLVFSMLACVLGYARLLKETRPNRPRQPDLKWLRTGIVTALPLLAASLATRGLVTFDRFILEELGGLDVLGAYVLYAGVAMAILSFIDAGIVDFTYPQLVARADRHDGAGFRATLAQAFRRLLFMTTFLVIAAILLMELLVPRLGKPVYADNLHLMYMLAVATVIQALSLIPHMALYGLRRDKVILHSQLAGFAVFCATAWLARPLAADAVLIALCAAWTTILIWKAFACREALRSFPFSPQDA